MANSPATRLQMLCQKCGSAEVVRDATASWNFTRQQWELAGDPCDDAYCEKCDAETKIIEVAVPSYAESLRHGL